MDFWCPSPKNSGLEFQVKLLHSKQNLILIITCICIFNKLVISRPHFRDHDALMSKIKFSKIFTGVRRALAMFTVAPPSLVVVPTSPVPSFLPLSQDGDTLLRV